MRTLLFTAAGAALVLLVAFDVYATVLRAGGDGDPDYARDEEKEEPAEMMSAE